MQVLCLTVGAIGTNCYFLVNEDNKECVIVDPGADAAAIIGYISQNGIVPHAIILTHGHFDHIGAVSELAQHYSIKVYAGAAEAELMQNTELNLSDAFGYKTVARADRLLADNEEFCAAGITFKTLYTPGHTIGSVCYYVPEYNVLMSGDTLFSESVGRTDFPTGSGKQMRISLRERIFTLPDCTVVYPGHGDSTQIDYEKENNPYA